jgi:hypothetical protein
MSALVITDLQATAINDLFNSLESAFLSSVVTESVQVLPAMTGYNTLTPDQKAQVKDVFLSVLAAFLYTINIPGELATGISTTVTLAKLTGGGSNGSFTVVNGLITAYSAPT